MSLTTRRSGRQSARPASFSVALDERAWPRSSSCFGQTPPQLFISPHPKRRDAMPFLRPVHWGPASGSGVSSRPFVRVPLKLAGAHSGLALSAICVVGELDQRRVIAIDASSTVHSFRWPPGGGRPPQITSTRRHCSTQLPASDSNKASCVALLDAAPLGGPARTLKEGAQILGGRLLALDEAPLWRLPDEKRRVRPEIAWIHKRLKGRGDGDDAVAPPPAKRARGRADAPE